MLRQDDIRFCTQLMRKHGVSYAFATRWFPRELQEATAVLYAFFRVPDDLVDEKKPGNTDPETALQSWRTAWQQTQRGEPAAHPVLRAAHDVFQTYHIPFSLGDDFLSAMAQDLSVTRYDTYADLEAYMYGSAAVVGIMMSYVIGFKNAETLLKARALGEAMQLTNFLRDIQEDYEGRGRIYLPQEDLRAFGVTESDIRSRQRSPEFIALMQHEIQRARTLYTHAETGIDELAPQGRFAVRVASRLYAAILTNIEAAQYDVFSKRVRTSLIEKILLTYSVWKTTKNTR